MSYTLKALVGIAVVVPVLVTAQGLVMQRNL